MTFNKLYKFSQQLEPKTTEFNRHELFQQERERLSQFLEQIKVRFTRILNEMEGDLLTLKIKEFPEDDWKEFAKLYKHLIQINKSLIDYKPYQAAQKIIDLVSSRDMKAKINTLDHIIQHFLHNNTVDFGGNSNSQLKQASVHSLEKLQYLARWLHEYMIQNPLLDGYSPGSQIDARVIPDPEFKEVGPDETTKVEKK